MSKADILFAQARALKDDLAKAVSFIDRMHHAVRREPADTQRLKRASETANRCCFRLHEVLDALEALMKGGDAGSPN